MFSTVANQFGKERMSDIKLNRMNWSCEEKKSRIVISGDYCTRIWLRFMIELEKNEQTNK